MAMFGNLFGRKAPVKSASSVDGFKSGTDFLGAILLWQFCSDDPILISKESTANAIRNIIPQRRELVPHWTSLYVAWLFRVVAKQKFGDDLSRDMMAAVYGRIATNEDRVPGIETISENIKYWFKQLDETLKEAMANPMQINGEDVPFAYPAALLFILRDSSSPYAKNATPEFEGFDIKVAKSLAEVQDASKPRIDHAIGKAEGLPR